MLTERRVEDLQVLQKYGRKDEMPFQAVESDLRDSRLRLRNLRPSRSSQRWSRRRGAAMRRAMHPQRAQRWAVSDLNPFLWPLKGMADMVRANRAPRDNEGPMAAMEHWTAAMTSASLDLYRDLRDAAVENTFFRTYGPASIGMAAQDRTPSRRNPCDVRDAPLIKEALSHIEEGDPTKAIVRTALLLMKAGTGRRRLSAMKRARELVGKDIGLLDMPPEAAREIIREQSYIVDYEPVKALVALPKLLRTVRGPAQAARSARSPGGPDRGQCQADHAAGRDPAPPLRRRDRRQSRRAGRSRRRCAENPPETAQGDGEAGHRPSIRRQPTREGKLMNDQPIELPESRHSIEDSARQAGPRHRHRQRAFDRVWLRQGLPQLGADLAMTYLNEKARPYVEPLAKELGASIFAPCDVGRERRARSGLRADPRDLGQPRHRAPFHRVRPEGGPAGPAPRQFERGLQGGDGHLLPFVHPHGAARRAPDDARAERCWP